MDRSPLGWRGALAALTAPMAAVVLLLSLAAGVLAHWTCRALDALAMAAAGALDEARRAAALMVREKT